VQVGDLVEMWVRREPSDFAACEFCQTVNHRSDARCHTCGCPLPVRDDAELAPEPPVVREQAAPVSAVKSLTNVMRLALLPPLLLFVGLWPAGTNRERRARRRSPRSPRPSRPRRIRTPQRTRAAGAGDLGLSEGEWRSCRAAAASSAAHEEAEPHGRRPREQHADANAEVADPVGSRPRWSETPGRLQRQQLLRPCHLRQQPMRGSQERASDQCREAIRQRQIDEARRNPSLMG
jgi:hypothetical protein